MSSSTSHFITSPRPGPSRDRAGRAGGPVELPHDEPAEQALLGALLIDNAALDLVEVLRLRPADFYVGLHQRVFAGLRTLHAAGRVADLVTVSGFLADRGEITDGDRICLASLPLACPSVAAAPDYAARVHELAHRRAEMARAARVLYGPTTSTNGRRPARRVSSSNNEMPERPEAEPGPLLPIIVTSNRPLRDVSRDALAALVAANDPPTIFQRGGALVRVRRDERGQPLIEPLGEAALRGRLARAANFLRVGADGSPRHVAPPLDVVRDLASIPGWPRVPSLAGLVGVPVLRPNGTVFAEPGFDSESGLYFAPAPGLKVPPIPERPTVEDVTRALGLIGEALCDFPFGGAADRANAIALLLTPIVRPAIAGAVPLAVITAPSPGTGKSLLASLASIIATGRPAGVMAETTDDEEWRKRITTVLKATQNVALIDNIQRPLGSPVLAAMLTSDIWEDRLLQTNQTARLPQRTTWIATGNSVRLVGDLPRRAYAITLDSKMERPWERTGFRHPDLIRWARESRGELLWSCLVLARHWVALGRPEAGVPALGSFEEWARTLGGILGAAGVEGFLGNAAQVHEVLAESHLGWEGFLRAWLREFGDEPVAVAQVAERLVSSSEFRDALPDDLADVIVKDCANRRRLGVVLRKRLGVRFADDGLRLGLATNDGHRNCRRWQVLVDAPPDASISGEAPGSPAGGPFVLGQTPLTGEDLPNVVDRLAGAGDGRLKYLLDLARSCGFLALSFAPGRAVSAGEAAWVRFTSRASSDDLDLVLAALVAHADAPVEEGR
jgi:hypothetical protein